MYEAWTTEFSAANMFSLLDNDENTWGDINFFVDDFYILYNVWFGLGMVSFINQTETVFFPIDWTHTCLSLDSVKSKVTVVADGQLLGEEEYKKEEDEGRPDNLSVLLGFDL